MSKNYIELNGKRYDAVTGAILGAAPTKRQTASTNSLKKHAKSRLATDMTTVRPTTLSAAAQPKLTRKARSQHGSPKIIAAHKPKPTATLMRHVVPKPKIAQKPAIKHAYPIKKQTSVVTVQRKQSVHKVDGIRLQRAGQITRSPHVGRFEAKTVTPIRARVQPLQVKAAPATTAKAASANKKPVVSTSMADKKVKLFEQALANAVSHEQPAHKPAKKKRLKAHRRAASTFVALAAVLTIGGFVVYLNKGSVELQVASAKAGFQANMPTYKPAGYTQQSTDVKDGKVAINFVSPASGDGFTLTQQTSDWNSQTLFDTLVAHSASYKAIQRNGNTIYIYDGDKAAWVDGGILYQIVGQADLSSDEITSLATSM